MLQHTKFYDSVIIVSEILKKRIKQSADFESPVNEAMLNVIVAADYLRAQNEGVCSDFDITPGQYNVLRILRGVGQEGHSRCEISKRMVERAPDVTRLVDRLEKQGLVVRDRSTEDKRQSITRITEKGLNLLEQMQPKFEEAARFWSEKLNLPEWIALSHLCEKIYDERA
jgi:DNA-binding MarR family transcriptional regulator